MQKEALLWHLRRVSPKFRAASVSGCKISTNSAISGCQSQPAANLTPSSRCRQGDGPVAVAPTGPGQRQAHGPRRSQAKPAHLHTPKSTSNCVRPVARVSNIGGTSLANDAHETPRHGGGRRPPRRKAASHGWGDCTVYNVQVFSVYATWSADPTYGLVTVLGLWG